MLESGSNKISHGQGNWLFRETRKQVRVQKVPRRGPPSGKSRAREAAGECTCRTEVGSLLNSLTSSTGVLPRGIGGCGLHRPSSVAGLGNRASREDPHLEEGSETIAYGEWQEFKDHALFTLAFLDDSAFQKHYVAGLFRTAQRFRPGIRELHPRCACRNEAG